jgi:hypothetical protein
MNTEPHKVLEASMAITIAGSSLIGWLPALASILSIIWFSVQIYESKTGQKILARIKQALGIS